ncbi:Sdd2p [Sporobolomyces salmoneus]|uniref:Sdd2p n=1 Tax=Sporobolomyces salmoneus TaxID=183962 RepID=UPI00316FA5DF
MDGDLEAIRAKRMAELQGSSSGGGPSSSRLPPGAAPGAGGAGAGGPGGAGGEDQAAKMAAEEEQRRTIMRQILSNEARERLSRIGLVKPERARSIEQLLMRMAQSGQLRGRVSEEQLIDVLDQVEAMEKGQSGAGGAGSGSKAAGKITFTRKSAYDSDDSF